MHRFSTPLKTEHRKVFWYFQGVEKGWNGNEWVNLPMSQLSDKLEMRNEFPPLFFFQIINITCWRIFLKLISTHALRISLDFKLAGWVTYRCQ